MIASQAHIVAAAFFRRGLLEALSYRAAFALKLLTVALSMGTFFYLARFIDLEDSPLLAPYGVDYLGFGLVGLVLLNLQHVAVSSCPQGIREAQLTGTLEAMLATPTPPWLVLLGTPLYRFATAFFWAVLYLLVGGILFGVRFGPVCWSTLLLALPLSIVAFASLGFLAAALTMVLRRSDPISYFLGGLSALVGGAFYPTAVLPEWVQYAARLLPITNTLEVVRRATFAAATPSDLAGELLGLAAFCAVTAPVGIFAFSRAVRRARVDGSLTHF